MTTPRILVGDAVPGLGAQAAKSLETELLEWPADNPTANPTDNPTDKPRHVLVQRITYDDTTVLGAVQINPTEIPAMIDHLRTCAVAAGVDLGGADAPALTPQENPQ